MPVSSEAKQAKNNERKKIVRESMALCVRKKKQKAREKEREREGERERDATE